MGHFFEITTGKSPDDHAEGDSIHYADGHLWFCGSMTTSVFVKDKDYGEDPDCKDNGHELLLGWISGISQAIKTKEPIDVKSNGIKLSIEYMSEGARFNFFVWENRSCFMFQVDEDKAMAFLDFLNEIHSRFNP